SLRGTFRSRRRRRPRGRAAHRRTEIRRRSHDPPAAPAHHAGRRRCLIRSSGKDTVVTWVRTSIVLLALFLGAVPARAQDDDSVRLLLDRIERMVKAGDSAAFIRLL